MFMSCVLFGGLWELPFRGGLCKGFVLCFVLVLGLLF